MNYKIPRDSVQILLHFCIINQRRLLNWLHLAGFHENMREIGKQNDFCLVTFVLERTIAKVINRNVSLNQKTSKLQLNVRRYLQDNNFPLNRIIILLRIQRHLQFLRIFDNAKLIIEHIFKHIRLDNECIKKCILKM